MEEAVRLDVEQRRREYVTASEQIGAANEGRASAERAFQSARVLFDAGRLTSLDLVDAELELTQARLRRVQALADARVAWARVERAVGE